MTTTMTHQDIQRAKLQAMRRRTHELQVLIRETAGQADELDFQVEALPPGRRAELKATAEGLRAKLPGLIQELHALEAKLPSSEPGVKVVTLEALMNRAAAAGDGENLFAHETTPYLPQEISHHWEGLTSAINQAA